MSTTTLTYQCRLITLQFQSRTAHTFFVKKCMDKNINPPIAAELYGNSASAMAEITVSFRTEEDAAAFILADIMPSDCERVG